MTLSEVVKKYQALAGGFGRAVALADFGLAQGEIEGVFSAFDEDYHISRFFHFTMDPALETVPGRTYQINGFAQSHVSLDTEIQTIL